MLNGEYGTNVGEVWNLADVLGNEIRKLFLEHVGEFNAAIIQICLRL